MKNRNSGKYLEDAVSKVLGKNTKENMHWRRLYDSHTARNWMSAQPADFFLAIPNIKFKSCHLECKSQKGKTFRLKKFSQHQTMVRWSWAGVAGFVLVHFYEVNKFVIVDVNNLEIGKPSWLLKDEKHFDTIEECLGRIIGWKV